MTTPTKTDDTFLVCQLCATSNEDEDSVEVRDCRHVICEDCWEAGGGCAICEEEEDNDHTN